jgi:phosphoribosylamine--glycine ligase
MAEGKLAAPSFSDDCTVVKYLVPDGYPDNPKKDAAVGLDPVQIEQAGAKVYFASVYEREGNIFTTGSRSFGVLGRGKTLGEAEGTAEKACGFVRGPVWHRKDIGTSALVGKRVERMRRLRGEG